VGYKLKVKSKFSSAHALRGYPGECKALHGHNFLVECVVKVKDLDKIGVGFDFRELKNQLDTVIARLDHKNLNETPPFDKINPTSENIAKYICEELQKLLPESVRITSLSVSESEKYTAIYEPDENL